MAERLTMTSDKGGLAFTFDLDITCRSSEMQKIVKLAEKLKHYEDLEEAGRLIELPCKVGDTVYFIGEDGSIIEKATRTIEEVMNYKPLIGKGCYLTREEAETKLKGAEKIK